MSRPFCMPISVNPEWPLMDASLVIIVGLPLLPSDALSVAVVADLLRGAGAVSESKSDLAVARPLSNGVRRELRLTGSGGTHPTRRASIKRKAA